MNDSSRRRAAIYVRISRDRTGAGLGVERQERDCRELARRNGWKVAKGAVYVDNDVSAYSGKPRPGYRKLLEAVRSGAVDIVLCWHTDRLHRSPVELEEWIAACELHGVEVRTVKAGPLDLATPSGRMVARQLGAVARFEVEHRSERVRAQKAEAAEAGKWRGGRRPYGYESDGVTVRPAEAAIVAECTERVLAGESLHSVTRDLNSRGLTTTTGTAWRPPELRSVLLRARNAGLIEYGGAEVEAQWPPIVDPAMWRELRRLLTDEGRRPPRSADARWLGSGVYLCGHPDCIGRGVTMLSATGHTRGAGGRRVPVYRCREGGSHLTRVAEPLDEFVSAVVIERLSRPDAHLLLAPPERGESLSALNTRRRDTEKRLNELAELFAQGTLTAAQLAAGTKELRARLETLDAEITAATSVSALSGYADAEDVRAAWEGATVGRRKAIVRELFTITLLPAPKGRPAGWTPGTSYFDPRYVLVQPRR